VIPHSVPIEYRISVNGIELVYFEWNHPARGSGPSILLAHATGFHARCWDRIADRLGDRHIIAVDQRGHGRSTSVEIENWQVFGEDLAELIGALELDSILGVGHSMGGHAMVDAVARGPKSFVGLYLFDPVIGEPASYGGDLAGHFTMFSEGGHPTGRRRSRFESPRAMIERFTDRPPYCHFDSAVFRDYCEHGLKRVGEGVFELLCVPNVEASVYMTSRSNVGIFESVRAITVPVLIARAKLSTPGLETIDFSQSPTWPELVDAFSDAREIFLPEATHFMPFEDPSAIASHIIEQIEYVSAHG